MEEQPSLQLPQLESRLSSLNFNFAGKELLICGQDLYIWENLQNPFSSLVRCNLDNFFCSTVPSPINICQQIFVDPQGTIIAINDATPTSLYVKQTEGSWMTVDLEDDNEYIINIFEWEGIFFIFQLTLGFIVVASYNMTFHSNTCEPSNQTTYAMYWTGTCFSDILNLGVNLSSILVNGTSFVAITGYSNYFVVVYITENSTSLAVWNSTTKLFEIVELPVEFQPYSSTFLQVYGDMITYAINTTEYGVYNVRTNNWTVPLSQFPLSVYNGTVWFLDKEEGFVSGMMSYDLQNGVTKNHNTPGYLFTNFIPQSTCYNSYVAQTTDHLLFIDFCNNYGLIWNSTWTVNYLEPLHSNYYNFVANETHVVAIFGNATGTFIFIYKGTNHVSGFQLDMNLFPLIQEAIYLYNNSLFLWGCPGSLASYCFQDQNPLVQINLNSGNITTLVQIPFSEYINSIYVVGDLVYFSGDFHLLPNVTKPQRFAVYSLSTGYIDSLFLLQSENYFPTPTLMAESLQPF